MKYIDIKRQQAPPHASTDFIHVFKHPNVTYLTGQTFSLLIKAANRHRETKFLLLYILRLLQFNFSALIQCQGSLPDIMREYPQDYQAFFTLYTSFIQKRVFEPAKTCEDQAISQVCTEIMASSTSILYKSTSEIVGNFFAELRKDPKSVSCAIFLEYFSEPINCDKLFSECGSNIEIFKLTCQVQKQFTLRMLHTHQSPASPH
jgi:hypothetical protein